MRVRMHEYTVDYHKSVMKVDNSVKTGIARRWYDEFIDIGYALGKVNMVILFFDRERKKEADYIWTPYIDPFNDDEFKVRFIEDRKNYFFIMYREQFK